MNHAGEITPLVDMVRPHVVIITNVGPVHLEHFADVDGDRPGQGGDFLRPGQGRRRHRQPRQRDLRRSRGGGAKPRRPATCSTFGANPAADARLAQFDAGHDVSRVHAHVLRPGPAFHAWRARPAHGDERPGRAARRSRVGARPRRRRRLARRRRGRRRDAARAKNCGSIPSGRTAHSADRRELQRQSRLDARGARRARRRPRRPAKAGASPRSATCWSLGRGGRRSTPALGRAVARRGVDLVFTAGPLMKPSFRRPAADKRGGLRANAGALAPIVAEAVEPGDVVMVKGSNGIAHARVGRGAWTALPTPARRSGRDAKLMN